MLLEGICMFIVVKFSHPKVRTLVLNPLNYGINNFEKVKFNSLKKDVCLNGYMIRSGNSKNTIIMCHGYGDNKFKVGGKRTNESIDYLKLAKIFQNQGFNILVFDFRGHGECGKNAGVTIGFNEQQDLLGAIDFIKKKGLANKIGLYGASMGAATSLSLLDKTKDVSFVIADCPFSDLKEYIQNNIGVWTGLPSFPFATITLLNFKLMYNVDFSKVSPVNSVKKSNIPILIIHGKKDITIPYTESVKISKGFNNKNSKLVLFDNSVHVGSYYIYGKEYERELINFLNERLF